MSGSAREDEGSECEVCCVLCCLVCHSVGSIMPVMLSVPPSIGTDITTANAVSFITIVDSGGDTVP